MMGRGILSPDPGPMLCPECAGPMVLSGGVVCPCCGSSDVYHCPWYPRRRRRGGHLDRCGSSDVYHCPWCHPDPTTHVGATSPHDQDQEGERHEND